MSLTMPQIVMLNHAAHVNRENAERKYEAEKSQKGEAPTTTTQAPRPPQCPDFSKMTSEQIVKYTMEDLASI